MSIRSKSDLLLSVIDLPVADGFAGQVYGARKALFRNDPRFFRVEATLPKCHATVSASLGISPGVPHVY